jgi:hypothetical protein
MEEKRQGGSDGVGRTSGERDIQWDGTHMEGGRERAREGTRERGCQGGSKGARVPESKQGSKGAREGARERGSQGGSKGAGQPGREQGRGWHLDLQRDSALVGAAGMAANTTNTLRAQVAAEDVMHQCCFLRATSSLISGLHTASDYSSLLMGEVCSCPDSDLPASITKTQQSEELSGPFAVFAS